jgi:hypothetical protein
MTAGAIARSWRRGIADLIMAANCRQRRLHAASHARNSAPAALRRPIERTSARTAGRRCAGERHQAAIIPSTPRCGRRLPLPAPQRTKLRLDSKLSFCS